MPQDRPAPPITITDPNNPTEYGDFLGSGDEKEPWRPSRRQLQVLLAVGLVLLVALPPTWWLKHRSDERAADRQALSAVVVSLVDLVDLGDGTPFALRNEGPFAITLLSARIDRDGYPAALPGTRLAAGDLVALTLPVDALCSTVVPRTGPSGVRVTVRTHRGDVRELRIDIRDSVSSLEVLERTKHHCGLFEAYESIEVVRSAVALRGTALTVSASVTNTSTLRRDLTALAVGDGFTVRSTPTLPLVVPPTAVGDRPDPVELQLRVTLTDCRLARETVEPPDGEHGFAAGDGLEAEVNDGEEAYLYLGQDFTAALQDLLNRTCRT